MRTWLFALCLALTIPTTVFAQATTELPIVREARVFMDGYAADLRNGDRAAIAARYDTDGAWIVQHGAPFHATHEQIARRYMTGWDGPADFAWSELTFVPAGEGAVTVIGRFDWTTPEGKVERLTYNGLLVRSADGLRIRMEDENPIPDEVQ